MTIETFRPGLQVYTANHFDASLSGRRGQPIAPHCAVALETQVFPDAPNQPAFRDAALRSGQLWRSPTVYSFEIC